MDVIVGTAGHIDHGKTALVKALTGVDADRLPEEKQRGITIDIGFAELPLDGVHVGFVDVPGHERFIRNMLAGASGIDLVVLVVAADEGVMPQTREHFDICRMLATDAGIVAISKKDLVDEEHLELVKMEIAEMTRGSFLEDAAVVAVSSKTGEGLSELKQTIREVALRIPNRNSESVTRLPIDRSFSMKGFGAVVTGTLVSGEILDSMELEVLPTGRSVRVRGIQTHGKSVKAAHAGQRTAVNLGGIDQDEISRGMVLAESGCLRATQILDARVEVLSGASAPLRSRQRVRVNIGTMEALARLDVLNERAEVAPGEKDFVQVRLESPVIAIPGDRFIIRHYSPQMTVAGGIVLDNMSTKHKRKDLPAVRSVLQELLSESPESRVHVFIKNAGESAISFTELIGRTGIRAEVLRKILDKAVSEGFAVRADDFLIGGDFFRVLSGKAMGAIEAFHSTEPLAKGMPLATLREKGLAGVRPMIFKAVLDSLVTAKKVEVEMDVVRAASRTAALSGPESDLRDMFSEIFMKAGLEVPKLEEILSSGVSSSRLKPDHVRKIFQLLIDSREIVKVSEEFYFRKEALDNLALQLREFASRSSDRLVDVPKFKDLAGVSRKYAIPLLEYFDREKITRRVGDRRVII